MMDEREGKRDIIGLIRKVVELAMPNLRSYYRMTRKAKIVGVYAADGQYFADVQPLRNDESVDDSEPVVPRVALPVLWGGPDRGLVCPPTAGTLCDLSFYDGDPNYPFISNIRYGLGQNAPRADLNELVIQLEPGVEMRIDKQKHLVTLTPEDIRAEAGKNWTIKAGKDANIEAENVARMKAPDIELCGHVTCKSYDGKGKGFAEFEGDIRINGDQEVTGDTKTGGNSTVGGNSEAATRSGGPCPH